MSKSMRHAPIYRRLMSASALLIASVAVAQINSPRKEIVQPIPPGASAALPQGSPDWPTASARAVQTADVGILADVDEWKRLQQSDGLGFAAYSRFIMRHPGWPGESRMRGLAEQGITALTPANEIVAFFSAFPPRTATGGARHALALEAIGRSGEARVAARNAWRMGGMSPEDEALLLGQFAASLSTYDHDTHADAALWVRNAYSAERALPYVSPHAQPIVAARIAMQRNATNAAALMQAVEVRGSSHAGYIADKAQWLAASGNTLLARELLAGRPALTTRPANVEKWYELLLSHARAAAKDGQNALAYSIASRIDDAYPSGTDVSERPLGERDDYTSLAWLAGTVAMDTLGRPTDAMAMFNRYASAARSPQTMSKGYYWAGRAAIVARDSANGNRLLQLAASYPDQFHGQLALERLGKPVPAPRPALSAHISAKERAAFEAESTVRAARALGLAGRWTDQSFFLRAIAANVTTDAERALAIELAERIGRPDLGVMVGRKARQDGSSAYNLASFPSLAVPSDHEPNWTMIHAITRQESQFDKAAVSSAKARGLMQLMPGTAQETAGKIGLSYSLDALTSDTSYNIRLGSSYFQRMLVRYGGCHPLAIAAYNAGPGNVNKWISANGNPCTGGADMISWIEAIPFSETRNYVQRVLENAVVYDTLRAQKLGMTSPTAPLSRYLGKAGAG